MQRVTVDAAVLFPDFLAEFDRVGQRHASRGCFNDIAMTVEGHDHEHGYEEQGSSIKNVPGPRFCKDL